MSTLTDVYQLLLTSQTPAQTSYILQFLWCDLTSGYRMGINFYGVQIFVDFVGSLYPRKYFYIYTDTHTL